MSKQEIKSNIIKLTNGGLAELLISNLIGDVGPHQHTHGDTELLLNHVRDKFESIRSLVDALEEHKHTHTSCVLTLSHSRLVFGSKTTAGLRLL